MPNSQASTQTVYGGQTPSKPGHYFSTHPYTSTSSTNGSQAFRDHSLATFMGAPNNTPLASTRSAQEIEAAHQARVAAQINALADRLP
ncbi:hypothetical protein F4860DRAFT_511406 [Xylaria cubensis]|nr:hypothetical protein F4860DRAFT_511406 [Xylaria cubensis]